MPERDACEELHGERASVGMVASATREVIVHELGHVVFDLALDERGRRAFRSAFVRTGWRNAPFVPPSSSSPTSSRTGRSMRGPPTPRWLEPAELSRLLREHELPPVVGPWPTSSLAIRFRRRASHSLTAGRSQSTPKAGSARREAHPRLRRRCGEEGGPRGETWFPPSCRRWDSNPHALSRHRILSPARLPVPPLRRQTSG